MLGVPEELGGARGRALGGHLGAHGRGARTGRHGPRRGLPGARRRRDRARRCGATPTSRRPTCLSSSATTCPPRRCALLEPRPLFDPLQAPDRQRAKPTAATCSTAPRRWSRAPRRPSCSSSPPQLDGTEARPVRRRVQDRRDLPSTPSRRWASAPPATGRLDLRGRRAARRGAARRAATPRVYAECVAARPARLVRAGGRHRPGGARLRDPLRQRAHGVRRADLPPPGGRVHGLQHRDRARGHAAGHLPRGQPRRPGHALRRARPRSRAACAPSAAWRSAPTACSCSAATATSRSTRSSAGTATCAPPA